MSDTLEHLTAHRERLDRDGYTILLDAFDAATAAALHDDIDRLERELHVEFASNGFEGRATTRVYNLLAHGALYEQVPVHPAVLPLMQHLLGDGCLVSSLSSITIHPGEVAQPIHADDQVIPIPKPHRAVTANSMWAITDFTEANGATRIIPAATSPTTPPSTGSTTRASAPRCPPAASWCGTAGCGTAAAPTPPASVDAAWR